MMSIIQYISPLLEVGIMAFVFYFILYFLRGTRGSNILLGIVIVLLVMWVLSSHIFHFEVVSFLLDRIWSLLAVALIVIFHPELRRAFAQLGTAPFFYRNRKKEAIAEVVTAVLNMSRRKCGALIVFECENGLRQIIDDAVKLDVKLNSLVIESLFYPNSPLHDGAVIVRDDRIVAAHAILPLSRDTNLHHEIGTRHRAAMGISEESDAVTLVVSEETGKISMTHEGVIHKNLGPEKLIRLLNEYLVERKPNKLIPIKMDNDIIYENNISEEDN